MEIITKFAQDSVYTLIDIGVRFNAALDHKHPGHSFSIRSELPEAPSIIYTLKCDKHTNNYNVTRIGSLLVLLLLLFKKI